MTKQTETIPNNHVVAVISGTGAAEQLRRELESAGYHETVLFEGEDVARAIDPKGEKPGPVGKLVKAVEDHLSEETNYLAQYQAEARSGNQVVAVPVKDEAEAEAVQPILARHGARNLRFFGRLAVTDLSAETNPSARSAKSPERQSTT